MFLKITIKFGIFSIPKMTYFKKRKTPLSEGSFLFLGASFSLCCKNNSSYFSEISLDIISLSRTV
jgi:hypothetical protein